jgi:hypothetical protein
MLERLVQRLPHAHALRYCIDEMWPKWDWVTDLRMFYSVLVTAVCAGVQQVCSMAHAALTSQETWQCSDIIQHAVNADHGSHELQISGGSLSRSCGWLQRLTPL